MAAQAGRDLLAEIVAAHNGGPGDARSRAIRMTYRGALLGNKDGVACHATPEGFVGVAHLQGWRATMEDAHLAQRVSVPFHGNCTVLLVCDGHGGDACSEAVVDVLWPAVVSRITDGSLRTLTRALQAAFVAVDTEVCREHIEEGTTVCLVLVTPVYIVTANAGDSRGIVVNAGGDAEALSHDHKPTDEEETKRINRAGCMVFNGRVQGTLALSRALGDWSHKQSEETPELNAVTAVPDVTVRARNAQQAWVVVACDGLWDVMTNNDVGAMLVKHAADHTAEELAARLASHAILDRGSTDNVSVIALRLPAAGTLDRTAWLARPAHKPGKPRTEHAQGVPYLRVLMRKNNIEAEGEALFDRLADARRMAAVGEATTAPRTAVVPPPAATAPPAVAAAAVAAPAPVASAATAPRRQPKTWAQVALRGHRVSGGPPPSAVVLPS